MVGLIIFSFMMLIGTYWLQGFTLISIMSTVSTLMFSGRKLGYFCKLKALIAIEAVGIGLYTLFIAMVGTLDWKSLLLTLVLRALFIAIAAYDIKVYVYVQKEVRRE